MCAIKLLTLAMMFQNSNLELLPQTLAYAVLLFLLQIVLSIHAYLTGLYHCSLKVYFSVITSPPRLRHHQQKSRSKNSKSQRFGT